MMSPSQPVPDASMKRTIERFEMEGYRGSFAVRPGGRLECLACHTLTPAGQIELYGKARIDVGTDPGDQTIVAAMSCPECNVKGTTTLAYGPMASREDSAVLAELTHDRIKPAQFHRLFGADRRDHADR